MLVEDRIYYSYADTRIKPAILTSTEHRQEGNPFLEDGYLPIFAAPMSTVVGNENYDMYKDNHIHPIFPRLNNTILERLLYSYRGDWAAYSLSEFDTHFCTELGYVTWRYIDSPTNTKCRVLIDVANGHMRKIYEMVEKSKSIWGDEIEIMVGNIAHPETYKSAFQAGADYVRLSVGSGAGCITGTQTGIGYPIASLIADTVKVRENLKKRYRNSKMPKIVADGGIRGYGDIARALAIGADYVMIGSLFTKMLESPAETYSCFKNKARKKVNVYQDDVKFSRGQGYLNGKKCTLQKTYYGMASKRGQKDMGLTNYKTAEGTTKILDVEYTMNGWVENFIDYIRSTMSYLDIRDISNMSEAEVIIESNNASNSINK